MKKINNCPLCKCEIWLPDDLCDVALRSSAVRFFCAYGHAQHFSDETINKYWAKQSPPPIPENSNVVLLFKGKEHETQSNP